MPLEDDFSDIIKKARTGLKLSVGDVARLTGLPGADITALERGDQLHDRAELLASPPRSGSVCHHWKKLC